MNEIMAANERAERFASTGRFDSDVFQRVEDRARKPEMLWVRSPIDQQHPVEIASGSRLAPSDGARNYDRGLGIIDLGKSLSDLVHQLSCTFFGRAYRWPRSAATLGKKFDWRGIHPGEVSQKSRRSARADVAARLKIRWA
jgi:hypothetical protein